MDATRGAQTRQLNTRNCFAIIGENMGSKELVKRSEMGGTRMGKYISIFLWNKPARKTKLGRNGHK
jgi:hypothetical protein